ncbi:fungal-specific transcription factor domain-containing protein [Xylariales sp. PMI_506]|nr:fungal-specific transcription factor domain-containing protein [Xylariales sp. PMI_506]
MDPRPAKRPKLTRSRNGCRNCRDDRKKCDETRPGCNTCLDRKIPCLGYNKPLVWSAKYLDYERKRPGSDRQSRRRPGRPTEKAPIANGDLPIPQQPASGSARGYFQLEKAGPRTRDSQGFGEEMDVLASGSSSTTSTPGAILEPRRDKSPPARGVAPRSPPHNQQAKMLLRRYYRINSAVTPQITMHEGSLLVEHYFRDVCGLYSTYDSPLNPFRSNIAQVWNHSAPIYYAIQSMAAAHLSSSYATMETLGMELKRKANVALMEELNYVQAGQKSSDCALLTSLLLGLSACWHSVGDLGSEYLRLARKLIQPRLMQTSPKPPKLARQDQFFEEALIYWELMMGFVSPSDILTQFDLQGDMWDPTRQPTLGDPEFRPDQQQFPHPWTGIGARVQILFAEVARVVRAERSARSLNYLDFSQVGDAVNRDLTATKLEESLLALEHPDPSLLVDTGDTNTSKADFITIAEATRCAALLEIYRVFPTILEKRLELNESVSISERQSFSQNARVGLNKGAKSHTSFLVSLAKHVLNLISQLEHDSGTRFLQLLILVVAAAELRTSHSSVNLDFLDLSNDDDSDVMAARIFAENRLKLHQSRLPAKPVSRILELIKEVWRLSDLGQDVFWLDIMVTYGWQTIMG